MMRAAVQAIREKRKKSESRILLTGATGFLGSHLAAGLVRMGYHLILLARPGRQATGRERIEAVLDWLSIPGSERRLIRVIEGTIDTPSLGLDRDLYDRLSREVDEIIHCASNTAFSERKRLQVEATNLAGLRNLLEFASKSRCFYFHHMSTAFVAGARAGVCPEELVRTEIFTNVYEETKYRGEVLAARICGQEGIRLNIYRPSIVYGDSRNGRSSKFNALYYPIRVLLFLRDLYLRDITENGGSRAGEMGVRLEEDGSIFLPIRINAKGTGGINLIPVDYLTDAFLTLMKECVEGGIYHIVNSESKNIEELLAYTRRFFQLSGIEVCRGEGNSRPRNGLEILFDAYNEAYQPYMQDDRVFDERQSAACLSKHGLICPEFDFQVFSRCMEYAVKSEWGKGLFRHLPSGFR
jgi:nucleoside-diphosphate-sugar epimerase